MDRAAEFCRSTIVQPGSVSDAHTALCAVRLLETEPDRKESRQAYDRLLRHTDDLALFKPTPTTGYGLTPLDFAPSPQSPRHEFFSTEAIDAHLDELGSARLDDGGWPLTWEPPGEGSTLAWRGMVTLNALRVLRAYGKI